MILDPHSHPPEQLPKQNPNHPFGLFLTPNNKLSPSSLCLKLWNPNLAATKSRNRLSWDAQRHATTCWLCGCFRSLPNSLIRNCRFAFESLFNYPIARYQMHVLTFWSNIKFLYPFFLRLYLLFSCTYCVCMLVSALGNAASVLILCRRWLHWRNPWPFALDVVHLLWSD